MESNFLISYPKSSVNKNLKRSASGLAAAKKNQRSCQWPGQLRGRALTEEMKHHRGGVDGGGKGGPLSGGAGTRAFLFGRSSLDVSPAPALEPQT